MKSDTQISFEQVSSLNKKLDNMEACVSLYNRLTSQLFSQISGLPPVCNVQMLPINRIESNAYNPNAMAPPENKLLKHSIERDGMTMPVIVNRAEKYDHYVLIDGFHRFELLKAYPDLQPLPGYIPCVIFCQSDQDSMSTSVRHNIARGSHQVELTADLVMQLRRVWSSERICRELGMDNDEVLRMQQITGLAVAFKDQGFSQAWE
ncbi:IbrB-like domain-containing protein [Vibrio ostreicida]|uniref:ParB/RepB/Spo0J family partition protein n=1 Tax=Vibrio ostreicida TaxID=526588 RepID=A0ABT8BSE4_9VIBR|nr:ParB/RepB/Spo0J family partition protein [Vibrio ostreicida]MDN3609901.1 ParB/RepB/Spo0J family partition protein [Vibrio ostreicida]NPD10020.1 ParB-like nuclease domain-containing protein [Vibrio ostreicida]